MGDPQGTLDVTDVEIGWLAGIIDGEGTIAFSVYSAPRYRDIRVKPQIIVTNTDRPLIERVSQIMGRLGVGAHFQTREQRHPEGFKAVRYRPLHVVNVSGFKRTLRLLPFIIPYLVTSKKEKGELVLRYMQQRLAKTAARGRWASLDIEDVTLMLEIVRFSGETSGKGPKAKNIDAIERLLRDLEQNQGSTPG